MTRPTCRLVSALDAVTTAMTTTTCLAVVGAALVGHGATRCLAASVVEGCRGTAAVTKITASSSSAKVEAGAAALRMVPPRSLMASAQLMVRGETLLPCPRCSP
jgi:hypothetical protein